MPNLDRRRRDAAFPIALAAVALFALIGIGLPLIGVRSFAGADLMLRSEPYRSAFAPTGFRVTNPCVGDSIDAGIPQSEQFRTRLFDGHWPQWTTIGTGGAPLGSVPDGAFLSPISLPELLLPPWLAPAYMKLLEIAVAVLGMYLFLRRLGLRSSSALVGGAAFVSSGFMVVWTNWPQTRTAAFIPWLFWSVERLAQERRWTSAAPIALVVACMIFSGFPAVTGYAMYAVGPYAVLRFWSSAGRDLKARLRVAVLAAAAVGVGVALTAVQLLPFAAQLTTRTASRGQSPAAHLAPLTLATALIPNALGSCAGLTYFGPMNDVETNAFVGAAVLVLVVLALVRKPSSSVPRGVRTYMFAAVGLTLILGWHGGELLRVAQKFPVFSDNYVGRIRSVLGFFLAALAAIGFDNLQHRAERRPRGAVTAELAVWAVAIGAVAFVLRRVQLASRASHLVSSSRYVLPLVVLALALLAVAVSSFRRVASVRVGPVSLHRLAVAAIPVLVLVESLAFVLPFWPRVPRDDFYPRLPAHTFLAANLDGQRMLAEGAAMLNGTNLYYGFDTPNGHAFTDPRWADLLRAVQPNVFRSTTYSAFQPLDVDAVRSPVLDRMAVKYLVATLGDATYGAEEQFGSDGGGSLGIPAGGSLDVSIPAQPLRGIVLHLRQPFMPRDKFARIGIDILDANGHLVATSSRRTYAQIGAGDFAVPIAAEAVPVSGMWRLRIHLISHDGTLLLAAANARPDLSLIKPADDGLRLEFVDDVAIYRRLTALPRFRWASRASVIPGDKAQLAAVTDGAVSADTVILGTNAPSGDGLGANVNVVRPNGDLLEARVDARGAGYLVVSNVLGKGWSARVDGKESPIERADYALAAVRVPAGAHVVRFTYEAPHARLGALLTTVAALVLLAAAVFAVRARRGRRERESVSV